MMKPTILICYSYRIYFNSEDVWYVGGNNLYYAENVRLLIILAKTASTEGRMMGSFTFRKVASPLAPRFLAASSSSSSMA